MQLPPSAAGEGPQIWLLFGEIALLTDMVKRTIIRVKSCADSLRLFRCILLRLFNLCLLYLFIYFLLPFKMVK